MIKPVEDLADLWFNPFIRYLRDGVLLEDKKKVHAIVKILKRYWLVESKIYRKTPLGPRLFCAIGESSLNLIKATHEGMYSSHSGGRIFSLRIMHKGYYMSTILVDNMPFIHAPSAPMNGVVSP